MYVPSILVPYKFVCTCANSKNLPSSIAADITSREVKL